MEETKIIPVKDFKEGEEIESEITFEGDVKFKKTKNVQKGRKSRGAGAKFELKVRADLESKDWVVDKWSNNIDLEEGKIIPAKRKFNPFSKVMTIGTGFPDFIAIQHLSEGRYSVMGVEVKVNGTLSKIEKEKCAFYLKNKIFREILIAKKKKVRRKIEIEYDNFLEKYGKKFGIGI